MQHKSTMKALCIKGQVISAGDWNMRKKRKRLVNSATELETCLLCGEGLKEEVNHVVLRRETKT